MMPGGNGPGSRIAGGEPGAGADGTGDIESRRLRQLENRLRRLNTVLRSVRDVNQLITKVRDRETLLRSACDRLTETHVYDAAWIACFGDNGSGVNAAHAGLDGALAQSLMERLGNGDPPPCVSDALAGPGVSVVEDPAGQCAGCPLASAGSEVAAMTAILEHDGTTYGVLSVSMRAEFVSEEEKEIFGEMAGDIGFALHNIEREEHRQRAETALRRSERKFRDMFDNVNDAIAYIDSTGMIVDVNRRIEAMFGYAPEEIIGCRFADWQFAAPETMERVIQAFAQAVTEGTVQDLLAFEGRRKDATAVHVEASTRIVQPAGEDAAFLVILRDITDRKAVEDQLRQRNRELTALNAIASSVSQSIDLEQILENSLDEVLHILNIEHGAVVFFDREAGRADLKCARGADAEVLKAVSPIELGEGDRNVLARFSGSLFVESITDAADVMQAESFQFAARRDLKSAMIVPLTSQGEVLGGLCAFTQGDRVFTPEERELLTTIGHQISTAIENARLLEEASRARALDELHQLRTVLLASVSHELRAPLTSIKGLASSLVQRDVEWDPETQRDFLENIDHESDKLTHIVNDLMEMSQIDAGIMRLDRTATTISTIIEQLEDQLRHLVQSHRFEMHVPAVSAPINADEVRIGEVITNLVSNAAAYSEQGTCITLTAQETDDEVVVSVADEGIGIPPEHVDKVFDRFYRLESGVTRRRGGTGLGLSICKGIIEQHGGRIWVESRLGEGSVFRFSLPISDDGVGKSDGEIRD